MGLPGNADVFTNGDDLFWRDPQSGYATKVITAANAASELADLGASEAFTAALQAAGFIDDTTTNNAPAVQTALDAITALGYRIAKFPAYKNRIRMDSTITFDRAKIVIDLNWNEFNWRFSTTSAFKPTCSGGVAEYKRMPVIIQNGAILRRDESDVTMRDDSWINNIDAIELDTAVEPGAGRGILRNVITDGFRYGLKGGRNWYLVTLENCSFLRNCSAIAALDYTGGIFANSGEAIRVIGGIMWGYRIFHVEGIFLHVDTSLDYPSFGAASADADGNYQYVAKLNNGAQLHMVTSHVEFRDFFRAEDEAVIYLGADGVVDWKGGPLHLDIHAYDASVLANGPRGFPQFGKLKYLIKCTGSARAIHLRDLARSGTALFKSNSLIGFADGASFSPPVIDVGGNDQPHTTSLAGKSIAPILGDACQLNAAGTLVLGAAAGCGVLRDPNFALASIVDPWHFAGSGGGLAPGQTSRYVCTNWAMTIGGNKLILTKAAGAAGAANSTRVYCAIPIQRNRVAGVKFRIDKTGGAVGNVIQAQIHKVQAGPAAVTYQEIWTSVEQIGATKTIMTFAGNGAEGPVTFDTTDFAGTLDAGGRVMNNNRGTHFMLWLDIGVIDASTTPCVINISRVTMSEQ